MMGKYRSHLLTLGSDSIKQTLSTNYRLITEVGSCSFLKLAENQNNLIETGGK